MKTAFLASHHMWPAHYETAMELMNDHFHKKDEVFQLYCNFDLTTCDLNLEHSVEKCNECISKRKTGLSLLEGKVKEIKLVNVTPEIKKEIQKLPKKFGSFDELVAYKIEEYSVGFSVASSVVTLLQEPYLDTKKHEKLIYDYLYTSCAVYFSLKHSLKQNNIDRLYIYNGRFAHVRAALSASLSVGVDCILHENGCDKDHYSLYYNQMPQKKAYIQQLIKDQWDNSDQTEEEKIKIGSSFFQGNSNAEDQGWFSFVKNQKKGELPSNWDNSKKNIVIFNSTEDEFYCLDKEWYNDVYLNQLTGIKQIINDTQNWEDYHFYLRVHPHLHIKKSKELIELYKLKGKNFTLIKSDSSISSYALLSNCDKVLTFGSTMGIEATYWQKPSLVAGITNYEHLNVNYKIHTHEELLELLQKDLKPKDQLGAFIYGYYYKTFGEPFKTYKAKSVGYGEWEGESLHANYSTSRERNLRRLLKLPGMAIFKNKIDKSAYNKAKQKFFN